MRKRVFIIGGSACLAVFMWFWLPFTRETAPKVSAAEARAIAVKLTGFNTSSIVNEPILEECTERIPFLNKGVSSKLWKISFRDFIIKKKNGNDGSFKIHFDVLIDSESGDLVVARWISNEPEHYYKPDPPLEIAEAQLKSIGTTYEAFVGNPSITLSAAMDELSSNFGEIAAASSEVSAVCIIEKSTNNHGPVWAITTKAFPESGMAARRPEVPMWEKAVLRHSINATTGKWFTASNVPHWIEPINK